MLILLQEELRVRYRVGCGLLVMLEGQRAANRPARPSAEDWDAEMDRAPQARSRPMES